MIFTLLWIQNSPSESPTKDCSEPWKLTNIPSNPLVQIWVDDFLCMFGGRCDRSPESYISLPFNVPLKSQPHGQLFRTEGSLSSRSKTRTSSRQHRWIGDIGNFTFLVLLVLICIYQQMWGFPGFLKWWYPTTMGFPTKNDHFGVVWGYQHLRKHPCVLFAKQIQGSFNLRVVITVVIWLVHPIGRVVQSGGLNSVKRIQHHRTAKKRTYYFSFGVRQTGYKYYPIVMAIISDQPNSMEGDTLLGTNIFHFKGVCEDYLCFRPWLIWAMKKP